MTRIAKASGTFTFLLILAAALLAAPSDPQDWTHFVRIAAYGLQSNNADQIVADASISKVFGIEVDNDITGRYESFLDPTDKLKAIRAVAEKAHQAGNRAFVYIAGTECITANADQTAHTMAKEHPDWLQRKITGEPAIFGGGSAFWISKGDEDVWISPYAAEWRKTYMERVRQIAATGIDGIYVDIPYWMTHFDGWEDSWASFDDHTVEAFRRRTGLNARTDLKLGDFTDPNFRKWVEFRIQTITDFMQEIDKTAKSVNPEIKTIPEIYPGIEEEAVRVGADVYSLYAVNDAIAHEYEFDGGDHMASSRSPLDWFLYQIGMQSFRAFAGGKATWVLNYSWDGGKNVDPAESMQNLFMSQIMAGANSWDAQGHVMSGSNDLRTRARVFSWIESHQTTFFAPRQPIHPIGVYFSPATRNFFASTFLPSYRGILLLLMQKHLEYQIVTPRTLDEFKGRTLILPDIRVMDDMERDSLRAFQERGGRLIVTGAEIAQLPARGPVLRLPECPGKAYMAALEKDFASASPDSQEAFLRALQADDSIVVEASPAIATHIANVDGKPHVFFASFKGLEGGRKARQDPETNATVAVKGKHKADWLPFLGRIQRLRGREKQGKTTFTLPVIGKGGVLRIE